MFECIELKEFCGIRNCKSPIKLSKFTVLIGPNNSSKTTLLTALFLFPYPFGNYKLPIIQSDKFEFLSKYLEKDKKALVYRYSGKGEIECTINSKLLKLEVFDDGTLTMYFNGEKLESVGLIEELAKKIAKFIGFDFKGMDEFIGYTLLLPNNSSFRISLSDGLCKEWEKVEKTGAHFKLVRELIQKVIDDRFTEVVPRFDKLTLRKDLLNDTYYVKLENVGNGIKRVLTSMLWLEAIKPKVVLWDDIEASSHPSLIKSIIEWLAEHEWQTIISTHSIDVLHEVLLTEPKDAKILLLRKSNEDELRYKAYTLKELEEMFEEGYDVRKLIGI